MSDTHPGWEQILRMVEAERDGAQAQADLTAHLSQCDHCAALAKEAAGLLDRFERAKEHLPTARQVADTTAAVRAEIEQLAEWPRETLRARGWFDGLRAQVQEVWAELSDDSWQLSPTMRATAVDAQPRILLYETDSLSITVALTQDSDWGTTRVRGQVIPLDATPLPGGGIALLRCGRAEFETPLEEYGEFSFSKPCPTRPGGSLHLVIALAKRFVRIMLPATNARS